jgi:hypothetical protein
MTTNDPLARLESKAEAQVAKAEGDPQKRFELREAFYAHYGFGTPIAPRGYGEPDLAFIRWQIDRGVFGNEANDAPSNRGSAWWRAVDASILYDMALAKLVYEEQLADAAVGLDVHAWIAYIARPSPESWLRAHGASLVRGYLENRAAAFTESPAERIFMNEVLYRFLFLEAVAVALSEGTLDAAGKHEGDPRRWLADLVERMIALYPTTYPLPSGEIRSLDYVGKSAEGGLTPVLDLDLALPHLKALSALVAGVVKEPELDHAIKNGLPVYPELTPEVRAQLLARHAYVLRAMESP